MSEREKKASALAAKLASEEGQVANADYAEVRGVERPPEMWQQLVCADRPAYGLGGALALLHCLPHSSAHRNSTCQNYQALSANDSLAFAPAVWTLQWLHVCKLALNVSKLFLMYSHGVNGRAHVTEGPGTMFALSTQQPTLHCLGQQGGCM